MLTQACLTAVKLVLTGHVELDSQEQAGKQSL